MRKTLHKILIAFALAILIGMFGLWSFSSGPVTTEEDKKYLNAFINRWGIKEDSKSIGANYEREIAFISKIQDSVFKVIRGDGYPIPKEEVGNIRYYATVGKGACYDRALMMEKIFSLYQFKTRHAFLYFNNDSTPIRKLDIFNKRLLSHALLEIKTSKGWMAIDTRNAWLGLNENTEPMDLHEIRTHCRENPGSFRLRNKEPQSTLLDIYTHCNFNFVYGLYSRHGGFLQHKSWVKKMRELGLPIPDYNLTQITMNFL